MRCITLVKTKTFDGFMIIAEMISSRFNLLKASDGWREYLLKRRDAQLDEIAKSWYRLLGDEHHPPFADPINVNRRIASAIGCSRCGV